MKLTRRNFLWTGLLWLPRKSSAQLPLFDPGSFARKQATAGIPMTNLVQWLKADALSQSDDTEVTNWVASVGINATGSAGSTAPHFRTAVQNGLPVIRFDNSNDFLQTADYSSPISQPFCYFIVYKISSAGAGHVILDTAHNDTERVFLLRTNTQVWRPFAGALGTFNGLTESSTTWHILSVEWNGASSKFRFDGGTEATFSGTPGTQGPDSLRIGNANDGSNPSNADIGEILIYTGTIADKTAYFAYLNARWAIY